MDSVTAKEVVLSEKPRISEKTYLIEPTLLDELIYHSGSLPLCTTSFSILLWEEIMNLSQTLVNTSWKHWYRWQSFGTTPTSNLEQCQVIPSQGDLLGDPMSLDLGFPDIVTQVSTMQMGTVDPLEGGLEILLGSELGGIIGGSPTVGQSFLSLSVPTTIAPSPTFAAVWKIWILFRDRHTYSGYVAPKAVCSKG